MSGEPKHRRIHGLGLAGILGGIVLGALLGLFYGETMWLASGGAEKRLERLAKTLEQKEEFAQAKAAEGDTDKAEVLRGHLGAIQHEIERIEAMRKVSQETDLTVAQTVSRVVRFLGDIFLRMLLMIVVPLVVTSMICGITSLGDIRKMGRVGGQTLLYYLATTAVAVAIGIMLLQVLEPGRNADDTFAYVEPKIAAREDATLTSTLLEVVEGRPGDRGSGMIPANLLLAAGQMNILGLIVFSLVFGGALSTLGSRAKPMIELFQTLNEVIMKIVRLIILFTPVGVFGLVATNIADSGGGSAFFIELARLGKFTATITIGLALHTIFLFGVVAVFARRHPGTFFLGQGRALLTALSTDSSSATMPVTIECAKESGVSDRAAGFVIPLGATVNMNGTALYEAVAAIFIAQSVNETLGPVALATVFIVATFSAMGAPGIPNAGAVTLIIVLSAVNLPAAGIGTLLAIDWFVDRERTVVNVFGDAVGAAVIDRYLSEPESGVS